MDNRCLICKSDKISINYEGIIRNGGIGKYTDEPVPMYKCSSCGTIWHEPILNNETYYESDEYRLSLEDTIEEAEFYKKHDKESIDKLSYTGMIFRDKTVADIGCGCGAFLDMIYGLAKDIIAIEPTEKYRTALKRKGYHTYAYLSDALDSWGNQVDVVVSFDVIEHVNDPIGFARDIYKSLKDGGKCIIGTPTDAPVMRKLLGAIYERKLLFSTQHQWIFTEDSLKRIGVEAGFDADKISCKYFQRYGLANAFGWLNAKEQGSSIPDDMITDSMDQAWKCGLAEQGLADYIVLYAQK